MRYFWIVTMQARVLHGLGSEALTTNTIDGVIDVTPGMTREQAFRSVMIEAERAWRTTTAVHGPVSVLFYSLEPQAMRVAGSERI